MANLSIDTTSHVQAEQRWGFTLGCLIALFILMLLGLLHEEEVNGECQSAIRNRVKVLVRLIVLAVYVIVGYFGETLAVVELMGLVCCVQLLLVVFLEYVNRTSPSTSDDALSTLERNKPGLCEDDAQGQVARD